jgi:outer membrane receptor protein involved in Fe transport
VNLYGQYNVSGGLVGDGHIRVGVRNLFNNKPPLADETFGYRGSLASPIGRYLYVNVSKEF